MLGRVRFYGPARPADIRLSPVGCLAGTAPAHTRFTAGPLAFWVQAPVPSGGAAPPTSPVWAERSAGELTGLMWSRPVLQDRRARLRGRPDSVAGPLRARRMTRRTARRRGQRRHPGERRGYCVRGARVVVRARQCCGRAVAEEAGGALRRPVGAHAADGLGPDSRRLPHHAHDGTRRAHGRPLRQRRTRYATAPRRRLRSGAGLACPARRPPTRPGRAAASTAPHGTSADGDKRDLTGASLGRRQAMRAPGRTRTPTAGFVGRHDLRFTTGAWYPLEVLSLRPPASHAGALPLS